MSEEGGSDNKFIGEITSGAIIASCASALSYLVTNGFLTGYLSGFGFSEIFVLLRLEHIVRVAAIILASFMVIYNIAGFVPKKMLIFSLVVFYVFPYLFLPSLGLLVLLLIIGVTWTTLVFVLLVVVGAVISFLEYRSYRRRGTDLAGMISESAKYEVKYRSKTMLDHFDALPFSYTLVALLFILAPSLSEVLGSYQVSRPREYNTFEIGERRSIAIYSTGEGVLMVDIDEAASGSSVELAGSQRFMLWSELSGVKMTIERFRVQKSKILRGQTPRQGVKDFWRKNFGSWKGDWVP